MRFHTKSDFAEYYVSSADLVLDIGFVGQGKMFDDPMSAHHHLKSRAKEVYGLDIQDSPAYFQDPEHYKKISAEQFYWEGKKFDVIFAGDLIEHLPNPGLFLDTCKMHLAAGGRLLFTTPNTFNIYNLMGKLTRREPITNSDHVCYFNETTLRTLLKKCGWNIQSIDSIYTLNIKYKESVQKKFLNILYRLSMIWTDKYAETLGVVAIPDVRDEDYH